MALQTATVSQVLLQSPRFLGQVQPVCSIVNRDGSAANPAIVHAQALTALIRQEDTAMHPDHPAAKSWERTLEPPDSVFGRV